MLDGNDDDEFNMEILSVSNAMRHSHDHIIWVADNYNLYTQF